MTKSNFQSLFAMQVALGRIKKEKEKKAIRKFIDSLNDKGDYMECNKR